MGIPVAKDSAVLLVVDMQPDFMPGGALPVASGDRIIEPVRKLMESDIFGLMAATQDWHPRGHVSFASSHPGHKPFDEIDLYGHRQVLWPDHCVQGTAGAALHPGLPWERVDLIVRKATASDCDSYSTFRNNWNSRGERPATGLASFLRERGVTDVFLCGLARDYCCRWSAEDAADAGFHVVLIWDCTRPVDPSSNERVRSELEKKDVTIIRWADLMD
jgi:nicotinamidase/pyrazinamidase